MIKDFIYWYLLDKWLNWTENGRNSRKKRSNRQGSRRGSVSSDINPPDSTLKDAWPEENVSHNKTAAQVESRSRHSSNTSRNEERPPLSSSPSLFLRPLSSSRSPPPSTQRQSSEPPHSGTPYPVSINCLLINVINVIKLTLPN